MKKILQVSCSLIILSLLFSGCSSSLYTSNGASDNRPLLFEDEYEIKELSDVQSTGSAFWGIPISNKKYTGDGMLFYFNGVPIKTGSRSKVLPILSLLAIDYAFASYVVQPLFGEDTWDETYEQYSHQEYIPGNGWTDIYTTETNTYSDGYKISTLPAMMISLPFAGTINNFIWSGATAEAASTIERQLIEQNPDTDLFFFPKYQVKKYNVFNDGPQYLWFQKADINAKVKGATIRTTK